MRQRGTDPEVLAELKAIADRNNGILNPEDVVAAASKESSPLHAKFVWDDTEAAHQYRLWQARALIRVVVEVIPHPEGGREHQVFVSLSSDREEGGYRVLADVVANEAQYAELLNDALRELNRLKAKYKDLKELRSVFEALEEVRA